MFQLEELKRVVWSPKKQKSEVNGKSSLSIKGFEESDSRCTDRALLFTPIYLPGSDLGPQSSFPGRLSNCKNVVLALINKLSDVSQLTCNGSRPGVILSPKEHLATSGEISGFHNWSGGCYWHLVDMWLNILACAGQPPATKDYPEQNVRGVDYVPMLQLISRCLSLLRSLVQCTSFSILGDKTVHYLTFFLCFIPLNSKPKFSCPFLNGT